MPDFSAGARRFRASRPLRRPRSAGTGLPFILLNKFERGVDKRLRR